MHQRVKIDKKKIDFYYVMSINNFVMISPFGVVSSVIDLGSFVFPRF